MGDSKLSDPIHTKEHQANKTSSPRPKAAVATVKPTVNKKSQEESHHNESGAVGRTVPYDESEIMRREDGIADVYEKDVLHRHHVPRWWKGIRKDDIFFHFVILCFSVGSLLVCYYKYNDWKISVGISLMSFAFLETTGIYFGLVNRIRSIIEGLVPLIQRSGIPGIRKDK
uniref:Transmembrane protein 40 n=1 Tax=Sphenodon punctatus TaxID=8508 RepID=A0A8D0G5U6_SPHPU